MAYPQWYLSEFGKSFFEPSSAEVRLLGAPLCSQGIDSCIQFHKDNLSRVTVRLKLMSTHEALFLYKNCLSMPKWLHLLRSTPCFMSSMLAEMDIFQRESLSRLCNVALPESAWRQCSLPVRWGGLGVRSLIDLSPSAYLSSSFLASPLISADRKSVV